ncbi:MAG: inositol polyphosphate multikinase [Marteilia pararefringens]
MEHGDDPVFSNTNTEDSELDENNSVLECETSLSSIYYLKEPSYISNAKQKLFVCPDSLMQDFLKSPLHQSSDFSRDEMSSLIKVYNNLHPTFSDDKSYCNLNEYVFYEIINGNVEAVIKEFGFKKEDMDLILESICRSKPNQFQLIVPRYIVHVQDQRYITTVPPIQRYIIIEDIIGGPRDSKSFIDMKIGQYQRMKSDPDYGRKAGKMPFREKYGYTYDGSRIYDSESKIFKIMDKKQSHECDQNGIILHITEFINTERDKSKRVNLCASIILKLAEIKSVLSSKDNCFRLLSSSVLIIYDRLLDVKEEGALIVKLIDFERCVLMTSKDMSGTNGDENCILGINSLIIIFGDVQKSLENEFV